MSIIYSISANIYDHPNIGTEQSPLLPDYAKYSNVEVMARIGKTYDKPIFPGTVEPVAMYLTHDKNYESTPNLFLHQEDESSNLSNSLVSFAFRSNDVLSFETEINSVPEPASFVLFTIGVSVIAKRIRKSISHANKYSFNQFIPRSNPTTR